MATYPTDPGCIFCKIAAGQIPSAWVFESELAVAFLDINPLNHGHLLLVPRPHHARLVDLPEELSAHAGLVLPRLCRAVIAATAAEGLNVVINNGQVAGQTIDHVHWHVIPRHAGDPIRWPWPQGTYQGDELDRMRARVADAVKV